MCSLACAAEAQQGHTQASLPRCCAATSLDLLVGADSQGCGTQVQAKPQIVGSELLNALITDVGFGGVTGRVEFYDGSADADRWARVPNAPRVGWRWRTLERSDAHRYACPQVVPWRSTCRCRL